MGGKWLLTTYKPGAGYQRHVDCGFTSRVSTVLVYLSTLSRAEGGRTVFPRLKLHEPNLEGGGKEELGVEPNVGRALVWRNLREDGVCDSMTTHAAEPVAADATATKVIVQRWYHPSTTMMPRELPPNVGSGDNNDNDDNNGASNVWSPRLPEPPPLPGIESGTPMILCTESVESCRWYDEWSFF